MTDAKDDWMARDMEAAADVAPRVSADVMENMGRLMEEADAARKDGVVPPAKREALLGEAKRVGADENEVLDFAQYIDGAAD